MKTLPQEIKNKLASKPATPVTPWQWLEFQSVVRAVSVTGGKFTRMTAASQRVRLLTAFAAPISMTA